MRRFLRSVLSDVSYRTIRFTNGTRHGLRMLMYHRVTDAHPTDRLCVPVAHFAAQMKHLREAGFHTITFAQAVRWITGHGTPALPERAIVLTFDDGFEDNFLHAYPMMTRHGLTGCFFVPSGFIEAGQDGRRPSDRPMSWAQLRELLTAGHEIGAHSVSHAKLTAIDEAAMRREVRACKDVLERGLKRPVRFFCYPAGDYNSSVKRAVRESGYRGACTVEPGANDSGADPFALKRTEISAFDSLWDVEKKLAGAYDWLHSCVQLVKR